MYGNEQSPTSETAETSAPSADAEQQFWSAIAGHRKGDDLSAVAKLLNEEPELVHARFRGVAWGPNKWTAPGAKTPSEPPEDFLFTNSAVHFAAVNGHDDLLDLLLGSDAAPDDIGYEENKGLTPPIVLAAWEGTVETVRILLEHGADPNLSASAETAMYTAAEHGAKEKVDLLLQYGAQLDIFSAAIMGDAESVAIMLYAYPALSQARSLKRNRTPAEEARHHNQQTVIDLFEN